jgi:serine/threonine-protein kinase
VTPPPGGPSARFVPGAVFAGRYRIVGPLGKGGMGEVYRADDLRLGQPVALKFLPDQLRDDPERRERFVAEVRVARQVAHPAVCRVYDVGDADGQPFLSMEYVDGEDLASLLRRIGRLPPDKAVDIARHLCAGLAAAHDRGIVHRDLKPANVMLDGRGKVRITDFGLASLVEHIPGDDVRSGTPAYMAPEQLAGKEVSAASDLYALGVVLYELFTGRRPFDGRTPAELSRQHAEATPTNPSAVVDALDPAVERVILRCLEKDPALRPRSALAVAAALPGGDPLAAALAAGETPSPEMVAAAGHTDGLSPRAAGVLLASALALLAAVPFAGRQAQLASRITMDKPPVVLEDRARELLGALAAPTSVDDAAGYSLDLDYIQFVEQNDTRAERWQGLRRGRPAVIKFWYRGSPRPLVTTAADGRVSPQNPPLMVSGMSGVELDVQGRLVSFYVIPPQVEEAAAAGAADYGPLFTAAGLDRARFTETEPRWTPPFHSDARRAWAGYDPARPDLRLRIEAAAYRGRPVWFEILGDWSRPARMQAFEFSPGRAMANRFGAAVLLSVVVLGLALARHNLRQGRGDRRGALRLAVFAACADMVVWTLTAHHLTSSFIDEAVLLVHAVAFALLLGAAVWILYLAIEPYVRRSWPGTLVSWTRLLAGRGRDPVVGRDVLIGVGLGALIACDIPLARIYMPRWVGHPEAVPYAERLDSLLGLRMTAGAIVGQQVGAVAGALVFVLILVVLRLALRREWAAALALALLLSLQNSLASGLPLGYALPLRAVIVGVPVYLSARLGMLPLTVCLFVADLMVGFPTPATLNHWAAQGILLAMGTAAALAVYGFQTAAVRAPAVSAPASGSASRAA